jgi:GTP-binding protein Era
MESVHTLTSEPDVFANIRDSAPAELLGLLDQMVILLPEAVRYRLKQVFDSLPPEGDNLQRVLELVRSQWKDIQSQEEVQIAIVGPGQTGKSSLLAALSRRQLAGSKPVFTLVDIHDEYLGYKPDETLSEKLRDVDLILLILDGRYELSDSTKEMYERLNSLNRPVLVVLNKIDLVQAPRDAVKAARRRLRTSVFTTSALQPETIERLLKTILDTDPKALSSLTQSFPDFRRSICQGIVSQAALSGAIVGAIRIPIADLLPVTAIQTGMLLKIARTFGYPLNRERARELLPMLAAGVAAREGNHWLRHRYPEYRKLISISVAGIWTFVLGHAAIQYFEGFPNFLNGEASTDFPSPATSWEVH